MVAGPVQSFAKENVKARWTERYTSDAINKKFIGIPRGVYLGFVPSPTGLVLSLKPDIVLSYTGLTGAWVIASTVTGGTSGATALIRVITDGFILVDNVVGTFQVGETISSGPTNATLSSFVNEAVSLYRVVTNTPLVAGRSEDMIDVFTGDTVTLDFTGFPDGTYYVIGTATYQVGQATTGQIITRTTPPPADPDEVLICVATKLGLALTIAASAPTTRSEPFAFAGQRIGFMPGGSIEALQNAIAAVAEVIASRRLMNGTTAPAFSAGSPQTTGLPFRLNTDLSASSMASRLGKHLKDVRGNNFSLAVPSLSVNVSGSFSARNRDFEPVVDVTSLTLPAGVPTSILNEGSELIAVTLTGVVGVFSVGTQLVGSTSGATGIIRIIVGTVLHLNEVVGVFFIGETATVSGGPPSGTVSTINLREGAITSEDPPSSTSDNVRNIVAVAENNSSRKPTDGTGLVIFGRLYFGPNGVITGGEIALTGSLNFTNGAPGVAGVGTSFNTEIQGGDIIEGTDGRFYEVLTTPVLPNVLTLAESYVGTTAASGSRRRRRFTVKFFTKSGGVETPTNLAAGTYQLYFPAWFTAQNSNAGYELIALNPGDQPLGTKAEKNSAGTTGFREIINFIEGANITMSVTEAGGKIVVSIAAAGAGTPFPGFYGSTPAPDSGSGGAGSAGLASQGDHVHPLSSAYTNRDGIAANSSFGSGGGHVSGSVTVSLASTARVGFLFAVHAAGNQISLGVASLGASPQDNCVVVNATIQAFANFSNNAAGTTYAGTFSGNMISFARTGTDTILAFLLAAIGDKV